MNKSVRLTNLFAFKLKRSFSTNLVCLNMVKTQTTADNYLTRIIMDNQKQRNSLGIDMIRNLQEQIDKLDLNKCRVLVLSSSCPKVFSAGHNLKEFTFEKGKELHQNVFNEFTNLCLTLKNLSIPTIAEVHGLAAAAGYQLAASCDLIIASNRASFSTPGVKFGVFCSTPGVALSRNVSSKIALKMLFTGEAINAQQAYTHGIISEVVDTNQKLLEVRVNEIGKLIESNSKSIVALGKKCFYKQVEINDLKEAYKVASAVMVDNLTYEDTQSGLRSFAAKSKPVWTHSDKKLE